MNVFDLSSLAIDVYAKRKIEAWERLLKSILSSEETDWGVFREKLRSLLNVIFDQGKKSQKR